MYQVTDTTPKPLLSFRSHLHKLNGKMRDIAQYILDNPGGILQSKLNEVAVATGADSAQIVRLLQRLGFKGYSDLKTQLAAALVPGTRTLRRQLGDGCDSFDLLKENLGNSFASSIHDTFANLTEAEVTTAVERILKSRRILLGGFGSSSLAARDFQEKLVRLRRNAYFFSDVEFSRIFCAQLTSSDLLILFSFGGETPALQNYLALTAKNHVPVLAVTNFRDSMLGRAADHLVPTCADEQRLRIGTMDSTIAQFAVSSLLASMVARKAPQQTERHLKAML